MSIVLILSWYLGGCWAAAWMIRRGHSATPWCIGGALLGGLLWAVAVPCARMADRNVRWTADDPTIEPVGRLVVGLLNEPGDVSGAARSAARPDDHLLIVHPVGFEATSSLIETGEQDEAIRRTRAAQQQWSGSTETKVGAGHAAAVLERAVDGRRPALLVRGQVAGWAWRTALRRSIALGARFGCPVLHAPAGAGDRPATAPAARMERRA